MNNNIFIPFPCEEIYYNLSYDDLFEHEESNAETRLCSNGVMAVDTGKFTGRSPKDKFVVDQAPSNAHIDWGEINQKVRGPVFDELYQEVCSYLSHKKLYVTDAFAGDSDKFRMPVRIITEKAWQAHFCKNMFIEAPAADLETFTPEFTIYNACGFSDKNWQRHGLNSEVFVIFNLEKKCAIIGGTSYGGEMKKGIFSILNYYLPLQNVLTMHCSANVGSDNKSALFFGLSGTGKTTLSASPDRALIGDDEHGWDNEGIFNLEGGCYAKTIRLCHKSEPEIFDAIKLNALLENVVIDDDDNIDYFDASKTENTRVSYPLNHIKNSVLPHARGGHPNCIIFLCCDAFGVLPPVARLTPDQALYYFISGYTAKVAGTERGIDEPQAVFSPCFGGPFLTLPPHRYAELLGDKILCHQTNIYLINTGWSGGSYGIGERMPLSLTRSIVSAVLNGTIENSRFTKDSIFGFDTPTAIEGIKTNLLQPQNAWNDKKLYRETAEKLASMFIENFKNYKQEKPVIAAAGPKI